MTNESGDIVVKKIAADAQSLIPVARDEYSLTVGPDGPILLRDR